MFVTEHFLSGTVEEHVGYPVSTDGGGTWYPPLACRFLKLKYHIQSSYEKSLIERIIQFIKDRTESFDDYFPYRKKNCKLKHVKQWIICLHFIITKISSLNFTEPSEQLFAIQAYGTKKT